MTSQDRQEPEVKLVYISIKIIYSKKKYKCLQINKAYTKSKEFATHHFLSEDNGNIWGQSDYTIGRSTCLAYPG